MGSFAAYCKDKGLTFSEAAPSWRDVDPAEKLRYANQGRAIRDDRRDVEIPDIQIPELPYETFVGLGDIDYPMTVDQALETVAPNIANYHDEFLRMCDVHVDDVDDEIDDAPDPKRQCG